MQSGQKEIEVFSPGMLYGGLDVVTAKRSKSTCRNEAIAEAFHYMKIVEAWGTGLPRILNRCKEYGLQEPLFEEIGNGFMVTIYRKPTKPTKPTNSSKRRKEIDMQMNDSSDVEKRMIELLKARPGITTSEIMDLLKISVNQVKYYVKKLKETGKIERVGTNRRDTWLVH